MLSLLQKQMADTRPPPAAGMPSASALVGPYPIDEDALRKLKRLHDDGVIDDDYGKEVVRKGTFVRKR